MGFDSKVILAQNVEGLAEDRVKAKIRKWILGVVILLFLATGVALGTRKWGSIFSVARPSSGQMPVSKIAIFRKMSFLPNTKRVEAPDFYLRTLDGQNRTLRQDRGNVVLVNFWATWCPPCLREMPAMQRTYEKFKTQGFQIVAVSVDQGSSDAVRKFAENLNLKFQIVLDPEHTAKRAYQVKALPTTYLIGRGGRIVAYGMGARKWDGEAAFNLIEFLLKENG